jgi:hypothetical protein
MKLAKNDSTVAFYRKFLMLAIDPGLKAHQTLCVWASGSLDDRFHNWLLVSAQKAVKPEKKKRKIFYPSRTHQLTNSLANSSYLSLFTIANHW